MSFIASLAPLLGNRTNSLTITLSRSATGALTALVLPKIDLDESIEADPRVPPLKAALSNALVVELPDADPDAVFAAILTRASAARSTAEDTLNGYIASIEKAKADAKAAEDEKRAKAAEKGKATPAKGAKPTKPAAAPVDSDDSDDDEGEDDAPAATPAPPAAASTPAAAAPQPVGDLLSGIL